MGNCVGVGFCTFYLRGFSLMSSLLLSGNYPFMEILKSLGGRPLLSSTPRSSGNMGSLGNIVLGSNQTGTLEDRYELGEELGLGQFGVIRLCSDKVTGEVLACKSIAKERLVTPDDVRSVKLEIEIMTNLSGHPNVVALKAVFEEAAYVHLVMELCAGGELFHRLEKHGRYLEPEAAKLFKHLMEVVKYCHDNGVVHRDLKPENILLATKSVSSPIKLADFGLATYFTPGQNLHGTVGSPFYIAPEVLSGGYNQAADVWSAGVILYILLSGIPPFWGKTKSKIFNAVREAKLQFPKDPWSCISASAKDLISRMLCPDSKKRLTAVEVLGHPWITTQVEVLSQYSSSISVERETQISTSVVMGAESKVELIPPSLCGSSFSSLLIGNKACGGSGSFAFHSPLNANGSEPSSAMATTVSFSFLNSGSALEHSSLSDSKIQEQPPQRESSFGQLFAAAVSSLDSTNCMSQYATPVEDNGSETLTAETFNARCLVSHNKENRTIGLGELEQLNLNVSASIIRWASCTRLSGATSFHSSLVC